MDTAALHTDAGADGVDAVVERLDKHFGSLARGAHHVADGDEALHNLGNLVHQTLQEHRGGSRNDDARGGRLHFHAGHDGLERVALLVAVGRDLLRLGQHQLHAILVQHKDLLAPHLVDLAGDDLADAVLIFLVDDIFLVLQNLGTQVLAKSQNLAAREIGQLDVFHLLFPDLEVRLNLDGVRQGNLRALVLHLAVLDDFQGVLDLQVTTVHVHDDVELRVRSVFFDQSGAKHIFQNVHQSLTIYALGFLEFSKGVDKINVFFHCFMKLENSYCFFFMYMQINKLIHI